MAKDILNNLFTKCHDCKIKTYCEIHNDLAVKSKKAIALYSKKTRVNTNKFMNGDTLSKHNDELIRKYTRKVELDFINSIRNIDCIYEKKEITEDLKLLQTKYNFDDARVFLLVKQYLRQSILDFRAFKEAANSKLVTYKYTDDGQKIPIINPLLNYKLSSGSFISKLILDLDKITKEDIIIDNIETNNSLLFTDYLQKLPDKILPVVKIMPSKIQKRFSEVQTTK